MKDGITHRFRFLLHVVLTAVGFCVGGLAGLAIAGWLLSDVTKRLPPPRDATSPMVLIGGLIGGALGVVLAQFGAVLFAKSPRG